MTDIMSRGADVGYDDERDDETSRSRKLRRSKHDDSVDSESQNGTEESTRDDVASSDEDTPSPRRPSDVKNSSKSRDTLTPMKSTDSESSEQASDHPIANGGGAEDTMNGGDSLVEKRQSFTKSNTVVGSDAENRRGAYGSHRSMTEAPTRRLSGRRTSSGSASVSEEEVYEQKSASKLKAAWESRSNAESTGRSFSRPKPVGGNAGASTLKARFENLPSQPYQRRGSNTRSMSRSGSISEDGETPKNVSTSSLRARFEEKATESATPKRNFVINKGKAGEAAKKFNQGASTSTKCQVCDKSVYPMEKLEVEGQLYHKLCLKCETCKRTLGLGNYASLQGKFYCKPHLKQLFQLKGNYDEGFGREQRKADWVKTDGPPPKSSTPAAETMQQENSVDKVADDSPKEVETEKEAEPEVNGHADTSETHDEPTTEQAEEETAEQVATTDDVDDDDVVENGHAEPEVVSAGDEETQNGNLSGGEETQNGNLSGGEESGEDH